MFLDLEFPRGVAAGASGGPERRTDIVALASGAEERNARWADSRRSYSVGLGLRDADDLAAVLALWEAARGPLHAFRFRDWADFKSCLPSAVPGPADQWIGTGDGATAAFQLRKRYGPALSYWRREVTKPVPGSVRVSIDGAEVAAGWSVDHLTGIITFTAPPAAGAEVRAGFLFDVPVRFAADALAIDMACFDEAGRAGLGAVPDIQLLEVRE